tara:strand:+ start:278 stop:574 length:297 start_codon:yes stop_codon:yes gene_type:complete
MADRYRLAVPRPGKDGKTYWTNIGVMFPLKGKDGFSIIFEALPIPSLNDRGDLECRAMVFDATDDQNRRQPSDHDQAKGNGYQNQGDDGDDIDDEIPF